MRQIKPGQLAFSARYKYSHTYLLIYLPTNRQTNGLKIIITPVVRTSFNNALVKNAASYISGQRSNSDIAKLGVGVYGKVQRATVDEPLFGGRHGWPTCRYCDDLKNRVVLMVAGRQVSCRIASNLAPHSHLAESADSRCTSLNVKSTAKRLQVEPTLRPCIPNNVIDKDANGYRIKVHFKWTASLLQIYYKSCITTA